MGKHKTVKEQFEKNRSDLITLLNSLAEEQIEQLTHLVDAVATAWGNNGKLMVCGNGGSASDAQHIVAELVGRFEMERPACGAIALTGNSSILTAVSNDYGFDRLFARQVEGLGNEQDVLLVITTSGNSANCIEAVKSAKRKGISCFGLLGAEGGAILEHLSGAIVVPSKCTARVQEVHIALGHLLCQILEQRLQEN